MATVLRSSQRLLTCPSVEWAITPLSVQHEMPSSKSEQCLFMGTVVHLISQWTPSRRCTLDASASRRPEVHKRCCSCCCESWGLSWQRQHLGRRWLRWDSASSHPGKNLGLRANALPFPRCWEQCFQNRRKSNILQWGKQPGFWTLPGKFYLISDLAMPWL